MNLTDRAIKFFYNDKELKGIILDKILVPFEDPFYNVKARSFSVTAYMVKEFETNKIYIIKPTDIIHVDEGESYSS